MMIIKADTKKKLQRNGLSEIACAERVSFYTKGHKRN